MLGHITIAPTAVHGVKFPTHNSRFEAKPHTVSMQHQQHSVTHAL
jgi:hypothetical protein